MDAHDKFYNTRTKPLVSFDKFVTDLADSNVFSGEEHKDSSVHYLKNKFFRGPVCSPG
jgi:uncharacterized iron-regulated protein